MLGPDLPPIPLGDELLTLMMGIQTTDVVSWRSLGNPWETSPYPLPLNGPELLNDRKQGFVICTAASPELTTTNHSVLAIFVVRVDEESAASSEIESNHLFCSNPEHPPSPSRLPDSSDIVGIMGYGEANVILPVMPPWYRFAALTLSPSAACSSLPRK